MFLVSSFWTSCRGAWVGLTVALIFLILTANCHRLKKWFLTLVFANILIFIPVLAGALYYFKGTKDGNRFLLYRGAWKMIKENPILGKGLGTFMDHVSQYTNNFGAYYAHNCYLQIWAESGVFSLLCFIIFLGYIFYRCLWLICHIQASVNFYLLIGLTASLLGFLINSFFDVHLYSFQLSFLFWTILGITMALSFSLHQQLKQ